MGSVSGTIASVVAIRSNGGTAAPPSESLRFPCGCMAAGEMGVPSPPAERLGPVPMTPAQSHGMLGDVVPVSAAVSAPAAASSPGPVPASGACPELLLEHEKPAKRTITIEGG